MKQQYAEKKCSEVSKSQVYKCDICDKRFKTPEFVHKHTFNKHKEKLDEKFNKIRFEDMFRENYMNDPHKFINTPSSNSMGGGYGGHGGYRDNRGGYRRRYDNFGGGHYDREKDERKKREYVDYDDPSRQ